MHKPKPNSLFITKWQLSKNYRLKFYALGDFTIDWGDGETERITNADTLENTTDNKCISHHYKDAGEYIITMSNTIEEFSVLNDPSALCLVELKQWGNARWLDMYAMFANAVNLQITATDKPDILKVRDIAFMFANCKNLITPMLRWNLKNVNTFTSALQGVPLFNQDLVKLNMRVQDKPIDLFAPKSNDEYIAEQQADAAKRKDEMNNITTDKRA